MKQKAKLLIVLLAILPFFSKAQSKIDYDYYLKRGNELAREHKWKEALLMFDSAIVFKPKSSDAFVGRGRVKIMYLSLIDGLKDYDTSILYADGVDKLKYIEMKEENIVYKITFKFDCTLGLSFKSLRKTSYFVSSSPFIKERQEIEQLPHGYIINMFNEAIDMFPKLLKPYIDRSNYFLTLNKYKEAIDDGKKAIELNHSTENYLNLYGIIRMLNYRDSMHKYSNEEILEIFNESIKNNPNNPKSYEDKAAFCECQTLFDQAKELYDSSIAVKPTFTNYFKLARLKVFIKEKDSTKYSINEILTDFKTALALVNNVEPFNETVNGFQDTTIKKRIFYKERSDFYSSIKQYDNAVKDLDSAMSITEPTFEDFVTRSNYKELSGKFAAKDILMDRKKGKALFDAERNRHFNLLKK